MKKAIKYLRFSSDGQSQHSIERQEIITSGWTSYHQITVTDTFIDEGYSARTFDRPDMNALMTFVKRNYRNIDYLVVAELTRFSREAGDAINMVKLIQKTYGIRIVSASRSCIYDVYDSNSFFMMGLEFLLGNSENIKRQNDINGGIYAAKSSGRWIQGGPAPFGFKKVGEGKDRHLEVDEEQAIIVRFIYDAFLKNTPPYIIADDAKKMGMKRTSNGYIQDVLKNPLYMGFQFVKPYKENPGGLMALKDFAPIIDQHTWYSVQEKFKPRPRTTIAENYPLRGLLKCWCGKCLTGAASRNGVGKYFNYYKCQTSGHNNISANKAHAQLDEILSLLSLPDRMISAIAIKSDALIRERTRESKTLLTARKHDLEVVEKRIQSTEEKFIANQINFESYDKWHRQLRDQRNQLQAVITKLERDENQIHFLLQSNLRRLSDLRSIYTVSSTTGKQELLRQVFDNRLYYRQRVYRTPYIMPVFAHNINILNQKQLLFIDDMNGDSGQVEARRVELLSKHILQKLSTCLFHFIVSESNWK